ncbi:MAG: phosphatidylserine decarboxylase family protein [Bacteroidetes bacterium]|nr:phosphatidylserine decarboxylase family protein [Bacteroidota bacterium]
MHIHREGKATLLLTGSIAVAATIVLLTLPAQPGLLHYLLMLPGWALFGLMVNFFRNPARQTTPQPGAVIAPCDGKVVVIEEVNAPAPLHGKAIQVSIFMNPLNVHVNRSPVAGQVLHQEYRPGKYLMAFDPKSSELNEQTWLVMQDAHTGKSVGIKQIAGFLARRVVCYAKPGMSYVQGQEFGFIKLGSRVDLLLPPDAAVHVQLGQKTRGAETLIARIP